MNFLIVTNTPHKIKNGKVFAYGPYVKEMNVWLKEVNNVKVISFKSNEDINKIELSYDKNIEFIEVPTFNLTSIKDILKTIFSLPYILYVLFKNFIWSDHIHLRSPSNMALLGLFVQVFFPTKKKTVKYAANWDMSSSQPLSYKLQQSIMSNTFLSKNLKALVYGKWPNQTDNIKSFYTATYYDKEKEIVHPKTFDCQIKILYSGRLVESKRPLLTIKIVKKLLDKNIDVRLDILGDGDERKKLEKYVKKNNLANNIFIHGRQNSETLKKFYKEAHFLVFLSKSEGWGKVITEAMFWGCLPITTDVGPIAYILGDGKRGELVEPNSEKVSKKILSLLNDYPTYESKVNNAIIWSQELTLDKFYKDIKELVHD